MNKSTAIIGAGGTGRGFLARLLQEDGAEVVLIDKNETLIQKLKEAEHYKITYGKHEYEVRNYRAYTLECEAAIQAAANAEWIFTSIGNEHLKELKPFLESVAREKKDAPLRIITCENGTCPKQVLRNAFPKEEQEKFLVTQGVIFCSSIPADNGIDILSEDYNELPYDVDEALFELPFPHFKPQKNFTELLERKIYTYNCLSACIAYLGAYKGYTDYADAGNDQEIRKLCDQLLEELNPAISRKYGVSEAEQQAFSVHALEKFSNRDISDTIYKNARAAIRKLSPEERIMGSVSLMLSAEKDPEILYLTAAAALLYLEEKEEMKLDGICYKEPVALFKALNPDAGIQAEKRIEAYYEELKSGKPLNEIMKKSDRR